MLIKTFEFLSALFGAGLAILANVSPFLVIAAVIKYLLS